MRLFTAAILSTAFAAMCGPLSAQDDLRPLVDIASQEASEDIPPPAPVPDQTLASPTMTNQTMQSGEMNAYDFGVSYESTANGLRISAVIVDSLAANSGVQPGDMIVAVNGSSPSGDPIMQNQVQSLTVLRSGKRKSISIGGGTVSPRTTVMSAPATPIRQAPSTSAPSTAYYAPRRTVAYSVPRTTYSAPARSYRYAPSYDYRYAPSPAVYRSSSRYYGGGYSRRPAVSIGIGTGGYRGVGVGYGGFGPGFGYGPSSFGRGFGGPSFGRYGGFGPGLSRGGRSGLSISFGF